MSMELSHHEQLLEGVMVEPAIQEMRKELTTYNASIIENADVTTDEVERIIDDLNEKYMPIFENGATISGFMEFPKPGSLRSETGEFETENRYYDEQEVEVYGFVVGSSEVRFSDDDVLIQPIIELHIGRNAEPHEKELETENVEMYVGMVRPEQVSIEPNTMSPERARAWLEYYYPDALVDLETRILNASNEAQGLVNLAGFSIELNNDEYLNRSRQALSMYLDTMLRFDMNVPYTTNMEGFVYVPDGEGAHSKGLISDGYYLTYFHQFYVVPDDLGESPVHVPMVELSVIHPDVDGDDYEVISPIETIKSSSSIRQISYDV